MPQRSLSPHGPAVSPSVRQQADGAGAEADESGPGASLLHSASLAARIPGIAAIEGNSRQYCPVGNRGWADRFPTIFRITDGTLGTAALDGPGLGFLPARGCRIIAAEADGIQTQGGYDVAGRHLSAVIVAGEQIGLVPILRLHRLVQTLLRLPRLGGIAVQINDLVALFVDVLVFSNAPPTSLTAIKVLRTFSEAGAHNTLAVLPCRNPLVNNQLRHRFGWQT
jgi:hypothetical protein